MDAWAAIIFRGIATMLVLAVGQCLTVQPAAAAEIILKAQAAPTGAVVRLGDVARIASNQPQEVELLSGIELFAAPSTGTVRHVRAREILDALQLRGVTLGEHVLSGANVVELTRPRPLPMLPAKPLPAMRRASPRNVSSGERDRVEQRVKDLVLRHLRRTSGTNRPWIISVTIDDDVLETLARLGREPEVSGAQAPWEGEQAMTLSWDAGEETQEAAFLATIDLPPQVVVAVRGIGRGEIVSPGDVRLEALASVRQGEICRTLDEVIGQEASRTISAGQPIAVADVHAPYLVRKGEVVTVFARAAGLSVRTTARSREDGAEGDLISVESLADRKSFFVRVCGSQEVEVYAKAEQAAPARSTVMERPGRAPLVGRSTRRSASASGIIAKDSP